MKKILLFAAVAAIGFSSCSQDEVIENVNNAKAIGFGTYVGQSPVSRADAAALTEMQKSGYAGIGVFANWTNSTGSFTPSTGTPNFMTNIKLTYGSSWGYADATQTKYWSNTADDKYSFFAYAPWVNGTTMTAGVIEVTSDNDTDILVASEFIDKKRSEFSGDKVSFVFKHAKAKLGVKAVLGSTEAAAGAELTVSDITIGEAATTKGFYTGGNLAMTLTSGKAAWTPTASTDTRTLQYGNFSSNTSADTHLVIPADYANIPVTVTYSLKQTDGSNEVTFGSQTATGIITSLDLEGSTAYTLTITVTLDAITFDVSEVSEWGPDNGKNGDADSE